MTKEIGKRIENIRNDLGMSKAKFGELIGVSGQYLGTVEKGKNGFSVDVIVNICEQTGISADYILFGIDDPIQKINTSRCLSGLSQEQIEIAFDVIKRIAEFIKSEGANEILIQEIYRLCNN